MSQPLNMSVAHTLWITAFPQIMTLSSKSKQVMTVLYYITFFFILTVPVPKVSYLKHRISWMNCENTHPWNINDANLPSLFHCCHDQIKDLLLLLLWFWLKNGREIPYRKNIMDYASEHLVCCGDHDTSPGRWAWKTCQGVDEHGLSLLI